MAIEITTLSKVPRPRRVCIFGDWGSGKTTLIQILAEGGYNVGLVDVEDGLSAIEEAPSDILDRIRVARCFGMKSQDVARACICMMQDSKLDLWALDSYSRVGGDIEYIEEDAHGEHGKEYFKPWQTMGRFLVRLLYKTLESKADTLIFTHAEKTFSKEGVLVEVAPKLPGKMTVKEFGDKFDFVWQIERDVDTSSPSGYSHHVYTKATSIRKTKSRLPRHLIDKLPARFPADDFATIWRTFIERRQTTEETKS